MFGHFTTLCMKGLRKPELSMRQFKYSTFPSLFNLELLGHPVYRYLLQASNKDVNESCCSVLIAEVNKIFAHLELSQLVESYIAILCNLYLVLSNCNKSKYVILFSFFLTNLCSNV